MVADSPLRDALTQLASTPGSLRVGVKFAASAWGRPASALRSFFWAAQEIPSMPSGKVGEVDLLLEGRFALTRADLPDGAGPGTDVTDPVNRLRRSAGLAPLPCRLEVVIAGWDADGRWHAVLWVA